LDQQNQNEQPAPLHEHQHLSCLPRLQNEILQALAETIPLLGWTAPKKPLLDAANLNMDCRHTEGRELCDGWDSDQLDNCHLSVVAATGHSTNNPCITTASITVAIQSFIEEGMDKLLIVDIANSAAS
jgi:hypothetical protein